MPTCIYNTANCRTGARENKHVSKYYVFCTCSTRTQQNTETHHQFDDSKSIVWFKSYYASNTKIYLLLGFPLNKKFNLFVVFEINCTLFRVSGSVFHVFNFINKKKLLLLLFRLLRCLHVRCVEIRCADNKRLKFLILKKYRLHRLYRT